ncbi:MAG: ABC transporter ATP-binding protein [Bacteroidota bacterium]|nr:ABC transporter ATP-binding protein [Bacteroidota bacterium]MDP4259277.1 ABC transporter ATP-binding protein [Bacteroidota bacterium]
MTNQKKIKKDVWKDIFRLILPHRRKFLWVVTLGLLSTGASLVEPLIYRVAINDVAGLFVRQARENAQKDLGLEPDEDAQVRSMIESETADSAALQPTAPANPGPVRENRLRSAVVKAPEAHARGHVASRSPSQALNTLLWAVVWLFAINLLGTLLWRLGENTNTRLSCLIEQRFIQSTFAHVLRLPLSYFSKHSSAAIAKQIDQSEEVTGIVNGFSQQILPELISLCGIVAIMFWQNVALTAVALITIPFYVLIAWRSAGKLESGLANYYSRWEEVSTRIQDGLSGIKTVKLSGAEEREVARLKASSDEAYRDFINRSQLANKYVFWETMLSHLSTALVFGFGGYLTLENRLTPGDVVMFVAYLDRLYGPIDSLASLWVELQQNVASLSRAFRLLDSGVEEKTGTPLVIREGRVVFEGVRFAYSAGQEVLKGLSFALEPGKATALIGTSGAGKTTTIDLLLKLYEPTEGRILIDGQDLADLDAASVRSQVGTVSADGAVFSGTLADNIRYKRSSASDQEVWQAALAAGMQSTLQRLPGGLQTLIGESGMGLSVGERQRIQIARVLVARPRILVLDEATANLDYATEAEVKRTIEEIRKENTVVIIAHRFSMVHDADHVIVLSEGQIIEEGSPGELIAMGGWFARFAHAVEEDEEVGGYEEDGEAEAQDGSDEEDAKK